MKAMTVSMRYRWGGPSPFGIQRTTTDRCQWDCFGSVRYICARESNLPVSTYNTIKYVHRGRRRKEVIRIKAVERSLPLKAYTLQLVGKSVEKLPSAMVVERVITVEYLEPSMSRDLLFKFPDTSPFDFDYNQSGIWSPLLPRHTYSIISADCFPSAAKRRKIRDGTEIMLQEKLRKASLKIQKAMKMAVSNSNTKKKMKRQSLDFSPSPVEGSAPRKGWSKVLRAAAKRFKKHQGSSLQLKKLPTT
ncbi:hypothetical protein ACLOJK_021865 [Asimina triloba]